MEILWNTDIQELTSFRLHFPDSGGAVLGLHVLTLCDSHVHAQDQLTIQSTGLPKRVPEV